MAKNYKCLVLFVINIVVICGRDTDARPQQTKPGCWYEGKRYQEAQVVNTTEPCLRCHCNEGSLRCRLRICPRLPSPSPSGCITRAPRDNLCCAELVCEDSHEKNVTARRDSAEDMGIQDNGCLHEGVRYAPGSAMVGSRRCEYCYCIPGGRRCVRPRCLLPLAGCTPLYAPYSCCPVAYNCTNSAYHTVPTLKMSSTSDNGCRVGDRIYNEGEMVREVAWNATCDNCFCAMGGIRCVPLACAPPLQGCSPIVREGHCCPSTYNCMHRLQELWTLLYNFADRHFVEDDCYSLEFSGGTIEVKSTQNYASYAFISKDYAKFRKETHFFTIDDVDDEDVATGNPTVEGRGHKNTERATASIPSQLETLPNSTTVRTTNTTKDLIDLELTTIGQTTTKKLTTKTTSKESTRKPIISRDDTETMNNEIPTETMNYAKFSTLQQETTFRTGWTMIETTDIPITFTSDSTNFDTTTTIATTLNGGGTSESMNSISFLEDLEKSSFIPTEASTIHFDVETTTDCSTIDDRPTTIDVEKELEIESTSVPEVTYKVQEDKGVEKKEVEKTMEFIKEINSTEGENSQEEMKDVLETIELGEDSVISVNPTGSPATILMPDNILVMNVTLKTNVSVGHVEGVTMNPVRSIPLDIEAILNITHRKKGEDYDYDYSQPTLPPSLPNVRIIPFVAADALVKTNEEDSTGVTNYPLGSVSVPHQKIGQIVAAGSIDNYYDIVTQENRFIPPIETEGGFMPREPPYFDPPYHSTDLNLEIRTGVTVISADMTNPHRKNNELSTNCIFENHKYRHGEVLPKSGHCIICICYYGEVACSDEKCPPLKIGCRRLEDEKVCCGKLVCVDAEESPTVVLDRADAIAASPRQPIASMDGVVSPDPFRDVIKTEPAPDLPSLIEDMMPHLVENRKTTPSTVTIQMTASTLESTVQGHYELHPNKNFPVESTIHISLANEQPPGHSQPDATMKKPQQIANLENQVTSTTRVSIMEEPLESTPIDHSQKQTQTSALISTTPKLEVSSQVVEPAEPEDEESSMFSFGSVFDLLFSENTEPSPTPATMEVTKYLEEPSRISLQDHDPIVTMVQEMTSSINIVTVPTPMSPSPTTGSTTWVELDEVTTTMSTLSAETESPALSQTRTTLASDNEIGTSSSSLLKLAGCNIYGRMYRVGRIITELSSTCLECRCTEIGVQCKQLEC